ncbi:MAG: heme o synthase [Terriglobia bacterium]
MTTAKLGGSQQRGRVFRLHDYWTLTKPEVNFLVLVSTLVGFYLGSTGALHFLLLLSTLFGTLLVASGTGTLNQYMERSFDAQMRRTAHRPIPAGRVTPNEALIFGLVLAASGGLFLAVMVNALASALALLTLGSYLVVYTPLKRRTAVCTWVGAIPGAMPPLIGWAAARGDLGLGAWVLYAMLFLWQFPHFMAIAWMYREDYSRAGYRMLPLSDRAGRAMAAHVLAFCVLLIPVSLVPSLLGQAGMIYLWGAMILGGGLLYYGIRLALARSNSLAKQLLMASVVYLPLVFALLMLDKVSI